ncbi:unnamed protein product [Dracunculus medinensis]|uniref:Major facilitator superfamily (MFS) profile domain-containing protein n=1 Tax=Dracunculus medinensis TaxID=318479 RepID=A0A3P7PEK2_DRAME|nr:unnamed protein product [Dracunculus medinensis]
MHLALLGFMGVMMVYAMRSSLSFSIVCMVNSTVNGTLIWPKSVQGSVLSAFFWGYTFSQIISGYLASLYGAKLVLGASMLFASLLTLISPFAALKSVYLFLGIRALLGFFQGSTFPAFHTLWSVWAPPLERSLLTGINYAGGQLGNVLVMPLSGFLCKYGFAGGWPSIYYILGFGGLMWCFLWFYFASDTPSRNRRITGEERKYIEESLKETLIKNSSQKYLIKSVMKISSTKFKFKIPWHEICTSVPVWATIIGHFAGDWGSYMMVTSLPLFMNDVFGFDLFSLGFLSAIPYIAYFASINIGGIVCDKLRSAEILSTIATRRLAMCLGLGCQAIFLILSGYCGCNQETLVVVFLTLSIGMSGLQYAGFVVNYLDIAPNFAGTLLGIGNTLSCLAGSLCPLLVGWLTPNGTKEEWQLVFWITGAILIIGTLIFSIFAKGNIQQWLEKFQLITIDKNR